MVSHASNPRIWETEAVDMLWIWWNPGMQWAPKRKGLKKKQQTLLWNAEGKNKHPHSKKPVKEFIGNIFHHTLVVP